MELLSEYSTLITLGLVTGSVTGLTGTSGVLVIIPLLTVFAGVPIHIAIGTSLLVDVIASIPVAGVYWKRGHVRAQSVGWMLVGALIGAQIGAKTSVAFFTEGMLVFSITAVMISVGTKMIFDAYRDKITAYESERDSTHHGSLRKWMGELSPSHRTVVLLIIGLIFGVFTGLFGAGGGMSIFVILYFFLGYHVKDAIGTSTALMALTALSGTLGYMRADSVLVFETILIGIGAFVGGIVASRYATQIPERYLKYIVGLLYLFLGIVVIFFRIS